MPVTKFTYTLGQHCLATGKNCHSPEEVGAIVRQLNKAEAERDALRESLQETADDMEALMDRLPEYTGGLNILRRAREALDFKGENQ